MIRKITILTLLAFASFTQARTRSVSSGSPDAALTPISTPGTTVSGSVTAVSGNILSLAGGLVTIDATGAKITDDRANTATIASITPGTFVYAWLSTSTVAANAPLPATMIAVTRVAQVTLSGPVQATGANTLTVLGRTIAVDANTSFGGVRVKALPDITINDLVIVQANASGASLLASSVLVFPPVPKPPTLIHGTVKTIAPDSWVITDRAKKDWTVAINAQTKIIGDPRVGDDVEILANVDNANQYVAVSIVKSPVVTPIIAFSGEVKSIGPSSWVIHDSGANKDVTIGINPTTKITGDPHVNDGVLVTATRDSAGNLTALTIIKLGIVPPTVVTLRGKVKSIAGILCPVGMTCPGIIWTIGPAVGLGPDTSFQVNGDTKIFGNPMVGDMVEVVAKNTSTGYVAISIVKQ